MTLLILSVGLVLIVSAICSLAEAAIYAVRTPYVRQLEHSGSRAGKILSGFKKSMERPITAILIVNTAANTAGAAVAGGQARALFGEKSLFLFSALFTLAVLFFSEILPKVVGVTYNRPVARFLSIPLSFLIRGLHPVVWLTQRVSSLLQRGDPRPIAPEEEVYQMALLSAEEGSILPIEAELVRNVLALNEIKAADIMTPRTVVFKLPSDATVSDVSDPDQWPHTRVPVYQTDKPDDWTGCVLLRDVLACLAKDRFDVPLEELKKPLHFVPTAMPAHQLLAEFLALKEHLVGVVDEYGSVVGVVTLEDVVESLIGEEIVDESDEVADLQDAARKQALSDSEEDTPPEKAVDKEEE